MLSPELIPIHERLVNIRRQLVALAAKETASQLSRAHSDSSSSDETTTGKLEFECKDKDATDESKTPTRDVPNPPPEAPQVPPKLKAELKPLQEELRKIDSLSASLKLQSTYLC